MAPISLSGNGTAPALISAAFPFGAPALSRTNTGHHSALSASTAPAQVAARLEIAAAVPRQIPRVHKSPCCVPSCAHREAGGWRVGSHQYQAAVEQQLPQIRLANDPLQAVRQDAKRASPRLKGAFHRCRPIRPTRPAPTLQPNRRRPPCARVPAQTPRPLHQCSVTR